MFYHFIKLILLCMAVAIGFPLSLFAGFLVAAITLNAYLGYWVIVILVVCIVLFVIIEGAITIIQMVRMIWK